MARTIRLEIDASDENADWIKLLDNGEAQRRDLAAHDAALAAYRRRQAQGGETDAAPDAGRGEGEAGA